MGSGFRTFATSEVLTASNVQNFLMEQSVMSFASTGARDVAITAPEAGMVAYIRSNDSSEGLYHYTSASSWRKGPGWNAPWGVVGHYETTSSYSTASTTIAEINTGYRLTVATAANRRLKFTFSANFSNATGGGLIDVYNITTSSSVGRITQRNGTFGSDVQNSGIVIAVSSSSSTTYTLRWAAVVSGTFSLNNLNSQFTIEDIGPSGAPA